MSTKRLAAILALDVIGYSRMMQKNAAGLQPLEQGRRLAAGLPNSRFVAYDSVNHVVPENDPVWPQLERDVEAFFAAHA